MVLKLEATIRGKWPLPLKEVTLKYVKSYSFIAICQKGSVVGDRVFACDIYIPLLSLNKGNTHASLETRELLTRSDCLPRKNGEVEDMHRGICTQRRKDTRY